MKLPIGLGDRLFVDTAVTDLHQAVLAELPVLVAIGPEPMAAVVVVLVGVAHGDAIAGKGPEFLDQPVVEFAVPFSGQERLDLSPAVQELGAIAPAGVLRIGQSDLGRVAAVPAVFGEPDLLDGGGFGKRRQRGRDMVDLS
jgi:hypothetical protein